MKKILVISAGRSDYDRYYPIIDKLNKKKNIKLYLFLTKAHFHKKFGYTVNFINKKFNIVKKSNQRSDFKEISEDFVADLDDFINTVKRLKPKMLIVLGDRYEMLLGPIACIPKNIPVIHFYGGAVTEGATDELVRHAITKMSHYHFVALSQYKKRLMQMGEESWRIKNIGVHNLNLIKSMRIMSKSILSKIFNFDFFIPYCLLTFHPVTLELANINSQLKNLIKAIKEHKLNVIVTYPNSDPRHNIIINTLEKQFKNKKKFLIIKNCGFKNYTSILKHSKFVIGNSSSGIVEAATLKIPSINIGTRQNGKYKPLNVINSNYSKKEITKSVKKALNTNFLKKIRKIKNPYESKVSLDKIANFIVKLKINDKLLRKRFVNIKL
tara:strand:+ start:3639 stop:4784 length:1146 start_codon:yes stop_codon:yes gene_type:complete